jgi:3-hydroxyisobutyrate dehydrogenase-like beta-hydroxyacid dehydrogenase
MDPERRVGVIGLGNMGGALAASLLQAGFPTWGFDIDRTRMELFEAGGGQGTNSPAEVAERCDTLITSLPSVRALEDVIAEDGGLLSAGRQDSVVIEMSTLPLDAKEAARESLRSISSVALDCPVSGTAAQARVGDLVVFASGDRAAVDRVAWVFETVGRSWHYLGDFGLGSKMKFIANLLIAVHNLAAAEALVLAKKAGMDPRTVHAVISDSAATSRMFEVSGRIMVDGAYADGEAKVEILHKDLQIIRSFATDARSPTPLLAITTEFYTAAMALGMHSMEDASVSVLLERLAGLGDLEFEQTQADGAPDP